MEKTNTKAIARAEVPADIVERMHKAEAKCNTCGYKNRKQRPELSRLCECREHDFAEAGNLGRLSVQDIQALFGSAAAERLIVSRMTADDGSAATEQSRQSIRYNLVDQLLAAGFTVTPEDYCNIMDGDYTAVRQAVVKSGRATALDAVTIAQQYERAWERKRERQVERGARAYREDKSLDKIAAGAAVAYMAANAAAVAASIVKAAKKLAK